MNAAEVLRELENLGVRLDVTGEKVHYDAPAGVMTPERLEQLRAVKPHLVELLGEPVGYRRAPRRRWCARCRELEAQGVRVLACHTCDVRLVEGA
jgi:hypothetical protein